MAGQRGAYALGGLRFSGALAAIAMALCCSVSAEAGLIPVATPTTGSRDDDFGLIATGQWESDDGFQIDWNITLSDSVYTYTYKLSRDGTNALTKDLSHWQLQVSNTFTKDNILEGSTEVVEDGPALWGNEGNSSPDIPGELFSLKYNPTDDNVFVLKTDRAPVWGSFYAKDGKSGGPGGGVEVYAYNAGFTGADDYNPDNVLPDGDDLGTRPAVLDPVPDGGYPADYFTNWIPTPDTTTTDPNTDDGVPEPFSLAIWGTMGLAGVVAHSRRRKKA
ncbi:MAG: hypothetical protein ACT4QC_00415 [Planctomycetaceae bacterium]